MNSKVREHLFGAEHKPRFTGQGVWRYNVPRPKELTRAQMCIGLPAGKCGFIPLTEEEGYVLLVQAESLQMHIPDDQLAPQFRARLAACTGFMAQLREQIVDSRLVVYRPLKAIFMPAPWYRGRTHADRRCRTCNDTAHGAGCSAGDGRCCRARRVLRRETRRVEQLFAEFMRRRFERCKFVFDASLQIGEWEQHPSPEADPTGLTAKLMPTLAVPI